MAVEIRGLLNDNMPNSIIPIPTFHGGASRQSPVVRHMNQVEEADNVLLTIKNGASKRPGSEMLFVVPSLTASTEYRLHAIDRDAVEKYLMVYGDSTLRIFQLDGTEITVLFGTDTQTYLDANSAGPDDLRLVTVADFTFLLNRTVNTGFLSSDDYVTASEQDDYGIMIRTTPVIDTFHSTRRDGSGFPAGFWKYEPGIGSFATYKGPSLSGAFTNLVNYQNGTYNPGGFKIGFPRQTLSITAGIWTATTRTLVEVGAFTNYVWRAGDKIHITNDGTGAVDVWHEVTEKTDDDTIVLKTELHASNQTGVTGNYIGLFATATIQASETTLNDMNDVANEIQLALRRDTAAEILTSWTATDSTTGFFSITSPFRGENAVALDPVAPDSGVDFTLNQLAAGTLANGTGTPETDTFDNVSRWTRQPAANQIKARFDPTKMPIQVTRHPASASDYTTEVTEDIPFAYWRLGESAGTTAADVLLNNDGTYVGTPTLGETGAISGDADTAVTFDGSTQYIDCGTMGNMGSQLGNGITAAAWVDTNAASAVQTIIDAADEDGSGESNGFKLWIGAQDRLRFSVNGVAGLTNVVEYQSDSTSLFQTAGFHHAAATWSPATNIIRLFVNGAEVDASIHLPGTSGPTPSGFINYVDALHIGTRLRDGTTRVGFFSGTIDEVSVYTRTLTPQQILNQHSAGTNTASVIFRADTANWKPRFTGTPITNPLPTIIDLELPLSDIALHRGRLTLAGDSNVFFSQSADELNFFIDDADNLVDSDPIDATIDADPERVVRVEHIVPFRKSLAIFARAGRQYVLNAPETLTPNTAAISSSTSFTSLPLVRPASMGPNLYFAATSQGTTQMREYFFDDTQITEDAADVSAHVAGFLPAELQTIVGLSNDLTLFAMDDGGNEFFMFTTFTQGRTREQAAWSKNTLDVNETLVDMAVIGNKVYLLVENADGFFISSIIGSPDAADSGYDFPVRLDNRLTLTGVLAAGETTWTLPVADSSVDTAVLSTAFGSDSGNTVALTEVDSTHVKATGDFTAGTAQVGRGYTMNLELSRLYIRDRQGVSRIDGSLGIKTLTLSHTNTGTYIVRVEQTNRTTRDRTFTPAGGNTEEQGQTNTFVRGRAGESGLKVSIRSTTPQPVNITSGEYLAEFISRNR